MPRRASADRIAARDAVRAKRTAELERVNKLGDLAEQFKLRGSAMEEIEAGTAEKIKAIEARARREIERVREQAEESKQEAREKAAETVGAMAELARTLGEVGEWLGLSLAEVRRQLAQQEAAQARRRSSEEPVTGAGQATEAASAHDQTIGTSPLPTQGDRGIDRLGDAPSLTTAAP